MFDSCTCAFVYRESFLLQKHNELGFGLTRRKDDKRGRSAEQSP